MPLPRPALTVAAALCSVVAGGCGSEPAEVAAVAAHGGGAAVVLHSTDGPVSLDAYAGRPVVVQLAASDEAEAWAALDEAAGDLEASGAVVVAVVVDEPEDPGPAQLGYQGAPLTVVVDGEGAVRGHVAPTSGDAVYEAAVAVLAEYDLAQTVAWPGAETVEDLVQAGGVVVDVGAEAAPPHALRLDPDALGADDLPADLGTPLAFVGPDATDAAEQAVGWGYAAVYAVDAEGGMVSVEPDLPAEPRTTRRQGGARG